MKTCYCCRRNEEEVRSELLRLVQEDFENEEKFVRMEMEEENKKVLDLQEEWESLKRRAANDLADVFKIDVFSILKGNSPVKADGLEAFFKNAEKALGSRLGAISPDSIERDIRDKIDSIKNLTEFNERMIEARERYEKAREAIGREKDWIVNATMRVGESSQGIPICKACLSAK
jgi:hypothetical protein